MTRLPAEQPTHQFRQPETLRTSELLREAATWLTIFASRTGAAQVTRAELEAVAFELRVRARWIEGARADEGVSHERRMGIAAIEDVETADRAIPAVRR